MSDPTPAWVFIAAMILLAVILVFNASLVGNLPRQSDLRCSAFVYPPKGCRP